MDVSSHYEDLLRRAELFNYIAGLVRSCEDGTAPRVAPAAVAPPPHDAPLGHPPVPALRGEPLPRITVIDRRVVCNGMSLDLARRPLTLRLFQVFCAAPGLKLTRDEMIRQVYRVPAGGERTQRYIDSLYANAVKLLSRSRILAASGLGGALPGIEWFVYENDAKIWRLYRLKQEYIPTSA